MLLIRHAHAGSRRDAHGPDRARRLSAKGVKQARSLVETLEGFALSGSCRALHSGASRPCCRSPKPSTSRWRRTTALAEGTGLAALALVRSVANEKIALCTHGDVIPEILVALADEDHLDLGPRPRQAKGSVWVLEAEGEPLRQGGLPAPAGLSRAVQISAKADYAVRALTELAAQGGGPVKGERLAAAQQIPPKFLEAILAQLRQAGLLQSRRGAEGGYWLARPPAEISIADVIRAADGPLASVRGERPGDGLLRGRGPAPHRGVGGPAGQPAHRLGGGDPAGSARGQPSARDAGSGGRSGRPNDPISRQAASGQLPRRVATGIRGARSSGGVRLCSPGGHVHGNRRP